MEVSFSQLFFLCISYAFDSIQSGRLAGSTVEKRAFDRSVADCFFLDDPRILERVGVLPAYRMALSGPGKTGSFRFTLKLCWISVGADDRNPDFLTSY